MAYSTAYGLQHPLGLWSTTPWPTAWPVSCSGMLPAAWPMLVLWPAAWLVAYGMAYSRPTARPMSYTPAAWPAQYAYCATRPIADGWALFSGPRRVIPASTQQSCARALGILRVWMDGTKEKVQRKEPLFSIGLLWSSNHPWPPGGNGAASRSRLGPEKLRSVVERIQPPQPFRGDRVCGVIYSCLPHSGHKFELRCAVQREGLSICHGEALMLADTLSRFLQLGSRRLA